MAKLSQLNEEGLIELYLRKKMSLGDIASLYGVSRVAIFKKLKKLRIKPRTKSLARLEAQKQGKVSQPYFKINERFFAHWSSEMSYVLGLIITDGCISREGSVSLSMNDKEILEKAKMAMSAEHPITASKHQQGLYCFHFARKRLVFDLAKLGIGPRKSLTAKFPPVPDTYLADFIRGVFDGDGSVFFVCGNKPSPVNSKFCSGSKDFIIGLEIRLQMLGLPKRNIYEQKTKNGLYYTIKYGHKDSQRLFKIMYKNYANIPFLERKYKKFIEGFERSFGHAERA